MPGKRKCLIIAIFCTVYLFVAKTRAYCDDCGAPSSSHADGSTQFEEMDIRELTQSEQKILASLFKSLSGEWQGEAETIECKGRTDELSAIKSSFSIRAKAHTDHFGNLRLETELSSRKKSETFSENLNFYLKDNMLRLDSDSGAGDIELIEVSKHQLRFLKRTFLSGGWGGGGPLHREIFVTLRRYPDGFSIEKMIYHQGKFIIRKIRNYEK